MDAISASVGRRLVGLTVQTLMNRMPISPRLVFCCNGNSPLLPRRVQERDDRRLQLLGLQENHEVISIRKDGQLRTRDEPEHFDGRPYSMVEGARTKSTPGTKFSQKTGLGPVP
ncbi:MAG TPA: hypothetical protein VGP76_14950 [Planctomycetaceae bacterium]|nr:hypothetical protein [Planctomycetaceae bacterium]